MAQQLGLNGRAAVVTGASRGIGFAMAERLAAAGASVVGVARSAEKLREAVAGLNAAVAVPGDVTQQADVERIFDETIDRFGRVDILVNAAGVLVWSAIEDLSLEDWNSSLAVNLTGVFLCSQAAVKRMLAQAPGPGGIRGHIVQIVSGAGVHGWVHAGAYSAAKFGVMGFSEVLREEVRTRGIKVTDVLPGMTETDMTALPDFASRHKLVPQDVAAAVLTALTAPAHVMVPRIEVRHILPQ